MDDIQKQPDGVTKLKRRLTSFFLSMALSMLIVGIAFYIDFRLACPDR